MEPVRDMRDFLRRLEEMREIKTLEGVDLNLEVGALTEFMGEREGPALLFGAFEGYPKGFRIVSNVFRTCRRTASVMGLPADLKGVNFLPLPAFQWVATICCGSSLNDPSPRSAASVKGGGAAELSEGTLDAGEHRGQMAVR